MSHGKMVLQKLEHHLFRYSSIWVSTFIKIKHQSSSPSSSFMNPPSTSLILTEMSNLNACFFTQELKESIIPTQSGTSDLGGNRMAGNGVKMWRERGKNRSETNLKYGSEIKMTSKNGHPSNKGGESTEMEDYIQPLLQKNNMGAWYLPWFRTFSLNQLESKGGAADALHNKKSWPLHLVVCPGVVVRMHEKLPGKTRQLWTCSSYGWWMGTETKNEGMFGYVDMLDRLPIVVSCILLLHMESNPIREEAYRHWSDFS